MRIAFLSVFLWTMQVVSATRQLKANALVACEGTTGITAKSLSVLYDHEKRTVYYNASVNIDFSGYVYADLDIFIYGLRAISTRINPCSRGNTLKELCPVNAGNIEIDSNSVLSESVTKHLPGVAFTVPDIDAYAIAKVKNDTTGEVLSCLYVEIQNTKTVEQTAVKWVTAVLSGVGLLISSVLVFLGTSIDSQNISAVTVMMLNYFQSMAFLDMEAVERVPPIASAWNDNIAWSVGLVYSNFLQKIYRWYVQSTGGNPATYMMYKTKSVIVQKLRKRSTDLAEKISPRSLEYLESMRSGYFTPEGKAMGATAWVSDALVKRASGEIQAKEAYAHSSATLQVYRGIERLSYKSGVEVTSAVMITYTIFIFVCVCVVFVFAVLWVLMRFGTKKVREEQILVNEKNQEISSVQGGVAHPDDVSATFTALEGPSSSRAAFFFYLIPWLMKGTLLKLWFVAFPSVMVFSMWEWTHVDSAAVVVVSVFMFATCLVLVFANIVRVWFIARKSQREMGTPAFLLYSKPKTLQKYGYLYSMFNAKYYYFGLVYLAYNFVKACFLAFGQQSGKTQALALFIIELAMFITVAVVKPFLSKAVNGIQIASHVVTTLNACFFLFFSNLMTQPLIVNGVMGVIFFVLNAAFSLVLLLYIIIYSIMCAVWHKRAGSRPDHHTTDDRHSFILDASGRTGEEVDELQALGHAAEADHEARYQPHQAEWFNHDGVDAHGNPFEPESSNDYYHGSTDPYNGPGAYNNSGAYDTRANTLNSEYSNGVFNDLAHPGHSVRDSQTSFGLDHTGSGSGSEETLNQAKESRTSRFTKVFRKR